MDPLSIQSRTNNLVRFVSTSLKSAYILFVFIQWRFVIHMERKFDLGLLRVEPYKIIRFGFLTRLKTALVCWTIKDHCMMKANDSNWKRDLVWVCWEFNSKKQFNLHQIIHKTLYAVLICWIIPLSWQSLLIYKLKAKFRLGPLTATSTRKT